MLNAILGKRTDVDPQIKKSIIVTKARLGVNLNYISYQPTTAYLVHTARRNVLLLLHTSTNYVHTEQYMLSNTCRVGTTRTSAMLDRLP